MVEGSATALLIILRNVQRMPPNEAGLSQEETANVLAYLFSRNGVEASTESLSANAFLASYVIPAQELVDSRFTPRLPSYATNGPLMPNSRLDDLTPVTNDMLLNPPADDWLVWRRTHSNLGHSPLSEGSAKKTMTCGLHGPGLCHRAPI